MAPFIDAYPVSPAGAEDYGNGLSAFNFAYSSPTTMNAYSIRVDHALTKSWNIFGRYNYSPSNAVERGAAGLTANTVFVVHTSTTTGTVGATWTKSSNIVNEIRFNYTHSGGGTYAYEDTYGGGAPAPGLPLLPSGYNYSNSVFSLDPLFGTDDAIYEGRNMTDVQHQYNIVDALSWQKGSHALKFGVDYRRLSPFFDPRQYNLYAFFSTMADFDQGNTAFTLLEPALSLTFLFRNLGAYAQDTWHVNPRLTLTYGVRWDVDFTPHVEGAPPLQSVTGFSYSDPSTLGLATAGTPVYGTRYGNFAPRVGAAYQISRDPNHSLVFRGGFGMFYDLSSSEIGNVDIGAYPYLSVVEYFGVPFPTSPALAAQPPIIPPSPTQGTLVGFDPHLNLPYTLEWSAALEQGLGKNQTLTLSYLGSAGRRLMLEESVTNPNANYASAVLIGNAGKSNYNALQAQFQRRLSRGLQALLSYSWSHSIDDGSYGAYTDGTFANLSANKGDSDFDIRNSFSAALTYEVPTVSQNVFAKAILGGWSTENIVQVRTAPPQAVVDAAFVSLSKESSSLVVRPDFVPGQPLYLYGNQYPGGKVLNPNAFTTPPTDPVTGFPLRQGDLGRNSLRGFGLTQWDFAVHRDFPIHEQIKLQFRAEMFNVLNHPNFGAFDGNFGISDPYFGQSTQMLNEASYAAGVIGNGGLSALYALGGPRSVQLALKLFF
jgi:hypothetical protein